MQSAVVAIVNPSVCLSVSVNGLVNRHPRPCI